MNIYTIGHSTHSKEEFIAILLSPSGIIKIDLV